jgi:hypothetical protein
MNQHIFTLVLCSRSLPFRSAWLIRKTIQSNRALYRDLAMEFLTVTAYKTRGLHECKVELIIASKILKQSMFLLSRKKIYYPEIETNFYLNISIL